MRRAAIAAALILGLALPAVAEPGRYALIFEVDPEAVAASRVAERMRGRLERLGIEAEIEAADWSGRIQVVVPADHGPDRLIAHLTSNGGLSFHLVADEACREPPPAEHWCLDSPYPEEAPLTVAREPLLAGAIVEQSAAGTDETGAPVVNLRLSAAAAEAFSEITAAHIGRRLAVVSDGAVLLAPTVRARIDGGALMISGDFSPEQARDLARRLNFRPYPASVAVIGVTHIGPVPGGWERALKNLRRYLPDL